jgi:hypothetical protein
MHLNEYFLSVNKIIFYSFILRGIVEIKLYFICWFHTIHFYQYHLINRL